MTIKHLDYGELIEVLGLEEENEYYDSGKACIQDYLKHVDYAQLVGERCHYPTVSKCKEWLEHFSQNDNHHAGGLTYRPLWKAMLTIEDNYSFLKAFVANLHLMWD